MKKTLDRAFRPVNPSPAALITSVDEAGRPNIVTLGEVFNISIGQPLIMGLAINPARYSHSLIKQSGEFVINLTTSAMADKVDICGFNSGRYGFDKFKESGLTPVAADKVRPPLIKECPVNMECKVVSMQTVGDHDLILGEVVVVHADENVINDSGQIDYDRLDLLVFITGSYWSLGKRLESPGYTKIRRKK